MNVLAATAVALRLLNPNDVAVDATLTCGEVMRTVRLDAYELRDVDGCQSGDALVPVVALQTFVDDEQQEWQQPAATDVLCGTRPMSVPLFACRNGVATAYVVPVEGATYTWSASGAVIIAGAGTNHVSVQLADTETATLTCLIQTECTQTATGVIALREPIVVKTFIVPEAVNANTPLTISWSYQPGREPASQVLTGDLFPQPVTLAPDVRSHTVTPQTAGMRNVELRASYSRSAVRKRRRPRGGGVSGSDCPAGTASARVDVRGCVSREPVVQAPEDAAAGATFEVKVADLLDGETVDWSVDNGRIALISGDRALVVAGALGRTEVHARVERGPGCVANGGASVAIIQPLANCSVPPSAELSLVSESCDRAVVRAKLTGKPPFKGRWSDGKEFRATGMYADHEFRSRGTYGMTEFHDASCFGRVSGSPSGTLPRPTVQLQGVEGCAGGEVTATFTGAPPFKGTWSDGQAFTTSNMTITRSVPVGTWSVQNVTDATCTVFKTSSNKITFGPPPRTNVAPREICWLPYDYQKGFTIETVGGKPPYVYEFADGTVWTTYLAKQPFSVTAPADKRTYELKRATANGCESTLENRFSTVTKRTPAEIYRGPITACVQTDIKIASVWQPSAGASLNWYVWGSGHNGADPVIVSGERSSEVTIRGRRVGEGQVGVKTFWTADCDYESVVLTINFQVCDDVEAQQASPDTIARR